MQSRKKNKLSIILMVIAMAVLLGICFNEKSASAQSDYIKVVSTLVYYDNDYSAINIDLYLNYLKSSSGYEITTGKIEGSNDKRNWTTLNVSASSTAPDTGVEGKTRLSYRLNIKNGNGQYRYYRIDIGYCPVNSTVPYSICTTEEIDIYEYEIVDLNGFSKEMDGWPISNIAGSFGYGTNKGENTKMPMERLGEVYEKNYTMAISSKLLKFNWVMSGFKGYCYGMALTAIAEYNNQIDLSDYFGFEALPRLSERSYYLSKLIDEEFGTYYTLAGYPEVIKLIEQCFLAQGSCEMYDVEIFKSEDEDSYYEELLEYLCSEDKKPLLVTCFHHAMVIETASEPVVGDNGWVKLPLYDVNLPTKANYIEWKYIAYGYESELWINTNNGKAKYINYDKTTDICERDKILFFDPSKLKADFFDFSGKLHFANETSYFGTYENVVIKNRADDIIFKSVDGDIVYSTDECTIKEWAAGDENNKFVTIEFGDEQFKIEASEDFSIISNDAIICIDTTENLNCLFDMEQCMVDVETSEDNYVEVAIQDDTTTDEPSSIIVGSDLQSNQNISVMKKGLNAKVDSKSNLNVNITLEDNNGKSEYTDVSLVSIEDIKIDELKLEQSINIVEIGSLNEIVKENGIEYTQEALELPCKVNVILDNGENIECDIVWDLTDENNANIYNSSLKEEQNFYVTGQIVLPQGIENNYGLSLLSKVKVIIKSVVENEKVNDDIVISDDKTESNETQDGIKDEINEVENNQTNDNKTEINKPGDKLSMIGVYWMLGAIGISILFCFIKKKSYKQI